MSLEKYLISEKASLFECLKQLNQLRTDINLFVVDEDGTLLGSVTDGDIRRGIIGGVGLNEQVVKVMNPSCKFLFAESIDLVTIREQRRKSIKILPILNASKKIVDLLNFNKVQTLLPVDAVIMAGGTGTRLLPLTQKTPKPLLHVGDKPIMAHNLDRLKKFGIKNIFITVNYLKEQIEDFVEAQADVDCKIVCITESQPFGTVGAVSLIKDWHNDYVLLTNSDLLTNIDYEAFFLEFMESGADMMVAAIPYPLKVPYAILETTGSSITAFKEKPEYMHYANSGIYLMKRAMLSYIPNNKFYNATDLMDDLLKDKRKLSFYPLVNYWLDIGNHEDFKKAQEDIKHLNF